MAFKFNSYRYMEAVMARARQLTEVMHALENDVRPLCVVGLYKFKSFN